MNGNGFRAVMHALRLLCGRGAIEAGLPEAVERARATRAFVVSSRSVGAGTDLVRRVATALGSRYAGAFDGIAKDSTFASVCAARDAARDAGADALIAIGGGSVMVATRAVAIFLAETGDPLLLMTRYPEGKPADSPRLLAPKLPIINIPTTPTSAMHRSGVGLKNPALDHRMEYFDPKTRPQAIFLDEAALLSAPASLLRSTATTVFAASVAAMANTAANPLAEASRDGAFSLAYRSYQELPDKADDPTLRTRFAVAALLQDRSEDDGLPRYRSGALAGNYAVSTALHVRYPHVGQGESTAAVHATAIRLSSDIDPQPARAVARGLEVWHDGMAAQDVAHAIADRLEQLYTASAMPTRLRQLQIRREDLPAVAAETVKNFNFNPGARSPQQGVGDALRLLEASY